jgi:hypothetical protein
MNSETGEPWRKVFALLHWLSQRDAQMKPRHLILNA